MSDVPTRLLRETLRAGLAAAPAADCLDSETLAAWSDGTLAARERAAAESHGSNCARCQALLAAMGRMTPPESPHRWWSPSTFRWLAPIAAAAIAAVLWINTPTRVRERSVAVQQAAPSSTSVSEPGAPASVPARPTHDDRTDQAKTARANVPPARSAASAPAANAEPQSSTSADEQRSAAAPGTPRSDLRRREPATATPKEARETPVSSPAAAPGPPLPPAAVAEATVPTASPTAPLTVAPTPSPAARAMSDQAGSRMRALAPVNGPAEIVSPGANVRWRILGDGRVARSIDGGATWQTQSTGVAATLTAGSAPSSTICWLVGAGGIVVVSTDGRTWQSVTFPEAIDLTSIRASDRAHATVTAADGRTFTTVDGGKTWRTV